MKPKESTARLENFRAGRFLLSGICLLLCTSLLGSCAPEGQPRASGLLELERLAFVGAGTAELSGALSPHVERALLVDRFEVTREEWSAWLATSPPAASGYPVEGAESSGAWPAVLMNFFEAEAYAKSRRMRLPTASEWFFVAMGPRAQNWPWDQYAAQAASNTQEVELASPSPVGVFEQGKTSHGVYDLIGNVWEWVDGDLSGTDSAASESTWVAGGSFAWPRRELYLVTSGFNAQSLHREHRSNAVGLRCVVDAAEFLQQYFGITPSDARAKEQLRLVGRRWGQSAVPLLSRLAEVAPSGSSLSFLLEGALE